MILLRAAVRSTGVRWRISKSPSMNAGSWRCSRQSPGTSRLEFTCYALVHGRSGGAPGFDWVELHDEGGSSIGRVGGPQSTAMSRHDRAADGQSQSQTGFLGGHERLEDQV